MKVVILAGGFGTRISEESKYIPKPLVEIGGKPILWHIMKTYSEYGFNEFIICLGYKGNLIKEYFYKLDLLNNDITIDFAQNKTIINHNNNVEPWKITLVDTGLNTMTGGRIKRIEKYIEEDTFMFTYGDGLGDVDIKKLLDEHKKSGNTLTVTAVNPKGRFGSIELNENQVIRFKEKELENDIWINAGFAVANKEIFNFIDGDNTILEKCTFSSIIDKNNMGVYKHYGFWKPMDTLKEKIELEEMWNNHNAPWKIWK